MPFFKKVLNQQQQLFFVLTFCLISNVIFSQTNKLTLVFDNIETIEGELSIGIFNNEEDFLNEGNEYKKLIISVDGKSVKRTVQLPEGEYAISVYHDENADKQCNRNFLGIPLESYGFSNNIKPKLSAPKFHQCKFDTSKQKVVSISLIH